MVGRFSTKSIKRQNTLLADIHRLNLVREAIHDNPKLKASDVEFQLSKPSYTITTINYLMEKYPQHTFALIMGEDNLRTLHKWFNYEVLLKNTKSMFIQERLRYKKNSMC
jgi:Nicotinic acid mononucleotide adenylyltransferase